MADTFTASNGFTVDRDPKGEIRVNGFSFIADGAELALREFFRAEEDARIGRWRWAKRPEYVVYPSALYATPSDVDLVQVVNESNGQSHRARRDDQERLFGFFSEAGAAYFDAHPEPKPWHEAQVGDVWVLTVDGEERAVRALSDASIGARFFPIEDDNGMTYGRRAPAITAGRRIWPEDAS